MYMIILCICVHDCIFYVCTCTCIMYLYMYVYVCTCTCTCMCMCVHDCIVYVCMSVHLHVCVVCTCMFMCVHVLCVHVYVYMYMYCVEAHECVCVYMYTHYIICTSCPEILFSFRHHAMNSSGIVLYAFTSFIAGIISSNFYHKINGENWVWNIMLTACLFAGKNVFVLSHHLHVFYLFIFSLNNLTC